MNNLNLSNKKNQQAGLVISDQIKLKTIPAKYY
jgi:hypothetical protein